MTKRLPVSYRMCQSFSDSVHKVLTQMQTLTNQAASVKETVSNDGNSRRPFTVLVEGNIGSGKSTYLKHFTKFQHSIDIVTEPVDKWRNLNSHNLLQMMYQDPARWSLTFQTYVQLTMLQAHTAKDKLARPVKMMERSLYSAKYCFAQNLRQTGHMPESEYQVLSKWFEFMLHSPDIDLGVDLIVYLQTSPEVALSRIRDRSRGEEHLISETYVRELHQLHERWLVDGKEHVPAPVLVVNADSDIGDMTRVFQEISDKVLNSETTQDNQRDDFEDNAVIEKAFEEEYKENDTLQKKEQDNQKSLKRSSSILSEVN